MSAEKDQILCCDWGTSSFRLRLIASDTFDIIDGLSTGDGVASQFSNWQTGGQSTSRFELYLSYLEDQIAALAKQTGRDLSAVPVIVSGMASSSLGMEELGYAALPFAIDGSNAFAKRFQVPRRDLVLVSGVQGANDVMRGEEAQVIGLETLTAKFSRGEHVVVFPGTHSKHIRIAGAEIVDFTTYMTGEIFQVISQHTILRDSIASGADLETVESRDAFRQGVSYAAGGLSILHNIFTTRTNALFGKISRPENFHYLSGMLIGEELLGLRSIREAAITIASGTNLHLPYQLACEALGLSEINFIEPGLIDAATVAGQIGIYRKIVGIYE